MELNETYILDALSRSASWKPGHKESFSFGDWDLTLRREEELYSPYTFSVTGEKRNSKETWSRRYTGMDKAFLHILNQFNENAYIQNRYSSLEEAIKHFPTQKPGIDTLIQSASSRASTPSPAAQGKEKSGPGRD